MTMASGDDAIGSSSDCPKQGTRGTPPGLKKAIRSRKLRQFCNRFISNPLPRPDLPSKQTIVPESVNLSRPNFSPQLPRFEFEREGSQIPPWGGPIFGDMRRMSASHETTLFSSGSSQKGQLVNPAPKLSKIWSSFASTFRFRLYESPRGNALKPAHLRASTLAAPVAHPEPIRTHNGVRYESSCSPPYLKLQRLGSPLVPVQGTELATDSPIGQTTPLVHLQPPRPERSRCMKKYLDRFELAMQNLALPPKKSKQPPMVDPDLETDFEACSKRMNPEHHCVHDWERGI